MDTSVETALSPLEYLALEAIHLAHREKGFPAPNSVSVLARRNTGAGRYSMLSCDLPVPLEDGFYDMGGHFIEMEGVPHGLMAVVSVISERFHEIEIAVYGNYEWDGSEREFRLA